MPTAHGVRRTSVIAPAHKPFFLQRIKDELISAGKQSFSGEAKLELPHIFLPGIFFPPLPGQAPRPRSMHYLSRVAFPADFCRLAFIEGNVSRQRRAKVPKTKFCFLQLFRILYAI